MALPEEEANKQTEIEQGETATRKTADDADAAVEETTEPSEDGEELSAEQALARALEDVTRFKDAALRAQAEMENMQKRTNRDVENAHKFGTERLVQNLLPVVDSIEKAVEAAGEQNDPMAEGVRLCQKLLLDVLHKEGVEILDPVGEPFDPNEHQAMSMVENADMEPNSVLAVVQKGVKLNGRLVRAAMVMVTKAPAAGDSGGD